MSPTRAVLASIALASAACGSTVPPPSASETPATIRPVTQAQLAVAHFRTADGLYGLVLDRTGAKPKVRFDGQADIVELTMREDRFASELRGYYLYTPDGKWPLYITPSGSVLFQHGDDQLPLLSDAEAAPLPAATVTGTYVPPPPRYEALAKRLSAISVRVKLPGFSPEDAANPGKVGDAVDRASADMFVHYASGGHKDVEPHEELTPESARGMAFGGVARTTDDKWNPQAKGLAKYGGRNEGFSDYDTPKGNHMQVLRLAGYPPPFPEGAPGLVWEVEGTRAVFVTLDGGRYLVDLPQGDEVLPLEAGAGPPAGWPAPGQRALLDVTAVGSLVKAGALPKKAEDDLLALDDAWNQCAEKVWAGVQRAIDSGRFTEVDRKDTMKKARVRCAGPLAKQEALLVQLVEGRVKERQALFDRAKAALAKMLTAPTAAQR